MTQETPKENDNVEFDNIEDVEKLRSTDMVNASRSGPSPPSPAEKALLRKLDWRILPILVLMYFLNFLDRAAITVARLDKMEKDLHLTSSQYQTCVSGLFIGYLLGQIPSSMLALFAFVAALTPSRHGHHESASIHLSRHGESPCAATF